MKTVFDAANNLEAHMAMHQLQQAGIHAEISGEFLQGGIGDLPATGNVQVIVHSDDVEEARTVITDWQAIVCDDEAPSQTTADLPFESITVGTTD